MNLQSLYTEIFSTQLLGLWWERFVTNSNDGNTYSPTQIMFTYRPCQPSSLRDVQLFASSTRHLIYFNSNKLCRHTQMFAQWTSCSCLSLHSTTFWDLVVVISIHYTPVSYTHLDVYKRQNQYRTRYNLQSTQHPKYTKY